MGSGTYDQTERRPSRSLPAVRFVVSVVEGPDTGRSVTVDAGRPRVLVGKSAVCDLVLTDPLVSRRHAALEVMDNRLCVTDLDSMNGTQGNGISLSVAYLEGGETIVLGDTSLAVELVPGDAPPPVKRAPFGRLIGLSPKMQVLYTLCERLAAADVPIVIEGETGTGKELLAECIHEASTRASGPFIVFDAASVPRTSLEVTLFGERGVGGAEGARGVFELAHGGTLLLDAIDELELEVQAKILRVIERGELLRVGDPQRRTINVRVLAATSRNLDKLVETKRFREDLFFRLAVTRVEVAPLRRRGEDVPLLARHFFQRLGAPPERADEFLERHEGYDWPGNVRELSNAVSAFCALGDAASLLSPRTPTAVTAARGREPVEQGDFITRVVDADLPFTDARARVLATFEKAYVQRVLSLHDGNVSRAAAASGLARRYFQTLRSRQQR